MARTIVIAASKGGSGKTTLSAALAAHAASTGEQVAVVDADPQQSFGLWHERRGWPQNPSCISAGEDRDLGSAIARAKAKATCVIVDLPGSLMRTDMAIRDADLIVIPVRPSMMDIEAVSPICELADEADVPRVFVLNAADKEWKLLGAAIDALAEIGDVLPESLRYHEGHPASMVQGQTAAEIKGPSSRVAKAEIAALWSALSKRATARKVRA
jgi:chromosome partitioning protein